MPDKSLGQHWLKDRTVLNAIAELADISPQDTILEIGPGLGTLTSVLLARARRVVAVEFDPNLAAKLAGQFPGKDLQIINQDILHFELNDLPPNYIVVANLPYYITSKIIQHLSTAANPPKRAVLLVQKEVAERLAAEPGNLSLLAIASQIYFNISLGPVVKAELFTPPPKVDSQAVVLHRRPEPLVTSQDVAPFFRLVKAGFASRRKKLRTALAGGLAIPKTEIEAQLIKAKIDPNLRAQDLAIDDWLRLSRL